MTRRELVEITLAAAIGSAAGAALVLVLLLIGASTR